MACIHQKMPVPLALVRTAYDFRTSAIRRDWQHQNVASPGSLSEISFQVVNLRSAIEKGDLTDEDVIRRAALQIDDDLFGWKATTSHGWHCHKVGLPHIRGSEVLNGQRHVYPSLWVAEVWNNWRILRVVIRQILLQNAAPLDMSDLLHEADRMAEICELSTDICVSTFSFERTPRKLCPLCA